MELKETMINHDEKKIEELDFNKGNYTFYFSYKDLQKDANAFYEIATINENCSFEQGLEFAQKHVSQFPNGIIKWFVSNDLMKQYSEHMLKQERERIVGDIKGLIEILADIEHDRWAKWQKYMHSKMNVQETAEHNTVIFFPNELFKRWSRQINTPYSKLSEDEKESDRNQVRPYMEIIIKAITNKDI